MITVHVNGRPMELEGSTDLYRLLVQHGIDLRVVAVAHNGMVIPRENLEITTLADGDRIEVVRMVGGG